MQTRRLGNSDRHLSAIGFGAWAIGGPGWKFSWGPQEDADSVAAIRKALECGVNWVDTAAVYGAGHSEEVVGAALEGLAPGERPFLATKCGRLINAGGAPYGDLRPQSVRRECEASLRRLKTERIDLYQIHWPDPEDEIEGAWTEMVRLAEEGKIRCLGVSNFNVAQMQRLQKIHPITSLQPPYNMLRREIETEILPFCKAQGIGVLAYSPMQSGLLSGAFDRARLERLAPEDWRHRSPHFREPAFPATLALVEGLKRIGEKRRAHRASCAQIALAWVLRREEITSAIAGARRPGQIEETARAGEVTLSPEELAAIDELLFERAAKLGEKIAGT